MRCVLQRVREASVEVDGTIVGSIGTGLLVFVGFHRDDTRDEIPRLVEKIAGLRIFEHEGKFDKSLDDSGGGLLIVSQFTLYGDCSRGRRPSFSEAMEPVKARMFFDEFVEKARQRTGHVENGVFQASMNVSLVNEGPVTIVLDSKDL